MDTNVASANTITSYEIHPRSLYGEVKKEFSCDLFRAVMVCVGKKKIKCYNEEKSSEVRLLNLLNVILDESMPPDEKLEILENDFSIEVTNKMREEMNLMCNLSDLVEERGEKRKVYELVNNYISRKGATIEEACDVLGVSLEEYYSAERFVKGMS